MVKDLNGVRGITNLITIIPKPASKEVKSQIMAAFHRHATLDANSVNVEVLNNKVVITGTVRSWAEKKDAEKAAWSTSGVTEVENKLDVATFDYA